jgi:long-chain acyl-CoA synthetase
MSNRADALFRQAARIPGKTAVIFEGREWTFSRLLDEAKAYATSLVDAGFRRGNKLAIMLVSRPEFIALEYAAFILGGTVVPLNIFYQGNEIEYALGMSDADILVIDADYATRLKDGYEKRCPALRRMFVFGENAKRPLMSDAATLRGDPAKAPPPVALGPDDVALMLFTSATTGKAKGVMQTIANLEANQDASPANLKLREDDVILCALPLYNTFALNQCINATVFLGATLVLLPKFDALVCLQMIERYRVTSFPTVPTMMQKVLDHPEVDKYDLRSLRQFCVGAAPVPAPLLSRLRERISKDAVVIHGYGLTESTALVTTLEVVMDENGEIIRPKSIGKALPGVEVAILDESGNPAPIGAVGEICVRGACVMKGYYKVPEATAEAIRDGWLHTGDLGTVDADGYFSIVDRKKDLIIRGGQNIYPADIEEALYHHPSVLEAAVIAQPDAMLGEVPRAFVALKSGARATPEELIAHCKTELAFYKVPVTIDILPELPKGPTGKIQRRALRA